MGTWIDWHSHHTPAEVADKIGRISGKTLKIDDYDGPDFSRRVAEMDAAGIDLQLISQGAGLYADQFPADFCERRVEIGSRKLIGQGVGINNVRERCSSKIEGETERRGRRQDGRDQRCMGSSARPERACRLRSSANPARHEARAMHES